MDKISMTNARDDRMPKKSTMKKIEAPPPATAKSVPSVTHAASLAARALARLEDAATKVHATETARRGFQAVSSPSGFQALIRHGGTTIEIQGDSFAIRQDDERTTHA
jgi:hypothetical protein